MAQDLTSSTVVEHPNADVIAGLRECADWLEQHPGLPAPYYATISFGYEVDGPDARERLSVLADALGDRATESAPGSAVTIGGHFGPVDVYASAKKRALVSAPPISDPEPILSRTEKAA